MQTHRPLISGLLCLTSERLRNAIGMYSFAGISDSECYHQGNLKFSEVAKSYGAQLLVADDFCEPADQRTITNGWSNGSQDKPT